MDRIRVKYTRPVPWVHELNVLVRHAGHARLAIAPFDLISARTERRQETSEGLLFESELKNLKEIPSGCVRALARGGITDFKKTKKEYIPDSHSHMQSVSAGSRATGKPQLSEPKNLTRLPQS